MAQLLSYPEVKRIPVEGFPRIGKDYLTDDEVEQLLGPGRKKVQEKVDGKSEWKMVKKAQVFYEFCKFRHSVPYTQLPSWEILFDAWDTINDSWIVDSIAFRVLQKRFGWSLVPTYMDTTIGTVTLGQLLSLLESKSGFNPKHQIEGIVIKNYDAGIFGKIVNPEFEDMVTAGVHPQKRRMQERNRLKLGRIFS